MILSQARSYHLGLVLAHQTTAQISDSLLEEITGNCGTQMAGRISGKDASKLANIWDPRFSKEIQQLASQEDYHWTIKMRAPPGQQQPTPLQFWLHHPPEINEDEQFLNEYISNQKRRYGNYNKTADETLETDNYSSVLQQKQIEKNRWLRYITVRLPEKRQWQIMVALYKQGPLQLTEITEQVKADTRDEVVSILKDMTNNKIIDKNDSTRNVKYFLSEKTVKDYFTFDHTKIGTAEDIPRVTQKVVDNYLDMGRVCHYCITIH